ncbi:MAG: hypothetical protein KAH32_07385 [Chlamydiia bacterium]|nr:hypothetical protein [Chlamydiia bacterium]
MNNTMSYTPAEQYTPQPDASEKKGNIISRASNWVSRTMSENPIIGGALGTVAGTALGMATGGLSLPMSLGVSAMANLPGALQSQATNTRERQLYNPEVGARYAGVFDGSGSNISNLMALKLRKMHSGAPSHLKPEIEKYMKSLGIPLGI